MTTEEALEAITDEGLFEKLVTAILRVADPSYARLIHVGVNAQGKTITNPVDGFIPKASGEKVVEAAHTTTARNSLRGKWLNPNTGDVTKAISRLAKSCSGSSEQCGVLVVSTNRAPTIKLIEDVGKICAAFNVELDLWERTRLADFLDNNAEGQWLRQKYLGIKAEHLPSSMLLSLSTKSYTEYASNIPEASKLASRSDERKSCRTQ